MEFLAVLEMPLKVDGVSERDFVDGTGRYGKETCRLDSFMFIIEFSGLDGEIKH